MKKEVSYTDVEAYPPGTTPLFSGEGTLIEAGRCIFPRHPGCEVTAIDRILTEHYDVQLCFHPDLPQFSFYPVPTLGFFAIDNLGGSFVCDGSPYFLHLPMDIYYLDRQRQMHYLAPSFTDFLSLVVFRPDWKLTLGIPAPLPTADEKMRRYLIDQFQLAPIDLPKQAPNKRFRFFASVAEAKAELPFV